MKKGVIVLILCLLLVPSIFAVEKIWYQVGRYLDENIDLSKAFYLPNYRKQFSQNKIPGDPDSGTYSALNVMGNFGIMGIDHRLEVTITTDGLFRSQSDPSKYREFYLAIRPRARKTGGSDGDYNLGSNGVVVSKDDRLINTKDTDSITYVMPAIPEGGAVIRTGENSYESKDRFHLDILVLMDELTAEDKQHLAAADDYVASFTISWHCLDCSSADHIGSYTVLLRGYYQSDEPTYSLVSLLVKPTPQASNLDILSILDDDTGSKKETIATMSFYCSSKENYQWKDKVYVFLSANDNGFGSSNSDGFRLYNTEDPNYYIPYKLNVYDGSNNKVGTFNGKDYCTSNSSKPSHYIDFTSSTKSMRSRDNDKTNYSVLFDGTVEIDFTESGITESFLRSNLEDYSGVYKSNIYYYVVTSDSKYY